ncbi:hypothetical protein N0V91_000758 [Didymella pomorum]|uniref:DUF7137 domain-containing protein n=1 Tax=Didymella pomorum TaxID=749634 RepID=A0A9W8ZQ55_9PLEO|nr:hypothetical protein N0V91_000758 [Didymella pomorum]
MRPSQLLAGLLALTSATAAMPDAFANMHGLGDVKNIFARQDDNSASASEKQSSDQPTRTSAPASSKASATNSDSNDDASTTEKASASGSQKASGSKTTGKSKATSYDARLPAGGISMVTPGALAGSQFYKVGDYVTFAWNYTSLSQTPSAIDILASCTANQATYTIAVNQSADQTQVVWDTKNTPSGQVPFLTEKYTLLIYDAESSVSAAPKAGYLGVFNSFQFGMYTPQPYVPFSEFNCANCNGALSQFEKMTLKAMLLTTGTTIGSLAYFTYTFGLW